ncbi:hypothetical protein GCM10010468_31410 [Actinocorallia longicatena]|uniref:MFS transporter n=1 Tax=Actinocorallia longicatena TaxID=111803 RepID=A0ABP6QES8_9ACTN
MTTEAVPLLLPYFQGVQHFGYFPAIVSNLGLGTRFVAAWAVVAPGMTVAAAIAEPNSTARTRGDRDVNDPRAGKERFDTSRTIAAC